MFINPCIINVGASRGNRALVLDVFSYVDVVFVVDPTVDVYGNAIDGDVGDFVFVSGIPGCDVHVFIRRSLLALVELVRSDKYRLVLGMFSGGVFGLIGGVYLRPKMLAADGEVALAAYKDCHIVVGDMNPRHDRWGYVADVGGHNVHGTAISRMLADMDFMVPSVTTHDGVSVIDLSAFRWEPKRYRLSHRAGLPHAAQIIKIEVDTDRLPLAKPAYTKANWDILPCDLEAIDPAAPGIWQQARTIVDSIPRKIHGRDRCRW